MQPEDQQPKEEQITNTTSEANGVAEVVDSVQESAAPVIPASQETPVVPAETTVSEAAPAALPVAPKKRGLGKAKALIVLVVAVVALLGASAGAYFGVIVPNKPENLLKSGLANTLKEKQVSYNLTVDAEAVDGAKADAIKATSVTAKGYTDLDTNVYQSDVSFAMSGIKVQAEVRYIDQTAYVKVGDLGAIKNLASGYLQDSTPLISKIENKWIEIDKTLLKQAKADCALNTKLTLSDADVKLLTDAYSKNSFAAVTGTSGDTVNGKAATKFDITIDEKKIESYAQSLNELSIVKQLKSCNKEVADKVTSDNKASSEDKTSFSVWVEKSNKRIVKLAAKTSDQDEKKQNVKGSGSIVLTYGKVAVEKPQNATPVMTILSEFAPLLQGSKVRGANTDNPLSLLGI